MYLPPATRTDQYVPAEQWSWTENDEGTTSIQPIVVNGAPTTALWSGGITVAQEHLSEPVNYLLDSRDETLEMQNQDCIRMTKLGKCCLRSLTHQDVGSLSGLGTETVKAAGLRLGKDLVSGYAARHEVYLYIFKNCTCTEKNLIGLKSYF